ncbi:MAG TPA: MMPL family transporter [Polyangia bacterium]|nr:MMPL family transporter [Polyangia bacterium]
MSVRRRPRSPLSARAQLGLAAALMAAAAIYCALRLKVTTDITHFLPAGSDHRLAELSRRLADSTLTRTLIVSVGGPSVDAVADAAREMAEGLRDHAEVAFVQRGPTDKLAESVYALYAPRTAYFVSDRPEEEIPAALSDAGLARAARALKNQLALPTSPLLGRLAGSDPLQWFPGILRRFERAQAGTLEIGGPAGDQFVTPEVADAPARAPRRWAIIFIGTRHSPFDSRAQAPLLDAVRARFAAVNRQAGGALALELGGVGPIALDAERRISGDLTRISILSTGAVVALFWLLFGGVRPVALALLPIVAGALAATAVGLALFGQLHGMTLAIGSTLIGVALDYPILLLTHRTLQPDEPPEAVLRRIWMGIFLGGATTAVGFAALGWTRFPGVRELAVTSSIGIVVAMLATRYVLPPLLRGRPAQARLLARGAAALGRGQRWLQARRGVALAIAVAVAVVCVAGLPRLRWLDGLRALDPADPRLKAELERVRARVSAMDEGRFVVAGARDLETALRANDEIFARLEKARAAGALDGLTSLHAFLWSQQLQRRNRAAVAAAPDLPGRTLAALRREGFRAEAFAGFAAAAGALGGAPPVPPLALADLQASPLAPLVRSFVVDLGDATGVLTFLRGVRDAAAVEAAVAGVLGARYFDQAAFLDETYARFRVQTLQAVGIGVALILAVLYGRYRRWRLSVAALAPAVLAAAATMGLLGLCGVPINLLHVLSLLLVLSMGVDYGVFLVEAARSDVPADATRMSVLACCLTTVLSFGLLALSATPALRAIGLVTGLGVLLSLLLAPLAMLLTGGARAGGTA